VTIAEIPPSDGLLRTRLSLWRMDGANTSYFRIPETLKEQLKWIQNSAIRAVVKPRRTPRQSSVVCATPKHEVIEALRWRERRRHRKTRASDSPAVAQQHLLEWTEKARDLSV
jgi:hypothetical protein